MTKTRTEKLEALRKLASERKKDSRSGYEGAYRNVSEVLPEELDWDDQISPWTKGAKEVGSDLMLIAQDWCSVEYLNNADIEELYQFGRTRHLQANRRVDDMLQEFFNHEFSTT